MKTLRARYSGPCANDCGVRIEPGDEVVYVDDAVVHADCEASPEPERPVTVCPTCHLTKPCDCT